MRYLEHIHYSNCLERDMTIRVYGHYGRTFLVFPCQNGQSDDYQLNGMIDHLKPYIEEGKIKLICVDAIDFETFSNQYNSYEHRAYMQEQYYYYVINEVLPLIYKENNGFTLPIVTGCSMGASQAAIMFFRRPDLFGGILALSGCYDMSYFWSWWVNEHVYNNSPALFLENMDINHHYINLYNQKKMVFCVGQGNYEYYVDWSFFKLRKSIERLGIKAIMDVWGNDVDHHWYWWKKQYDYFLPLFIDN